MHGQNIFEGEEVVHHAEDGLFDLARVTGATDQDQLFGEIEQNKDFRIRLIHILNSVETGTIDDREFWLVVSQLFRGSLDEHIAGKEAMPGVFADDANRQAIGRISASPAILDKDIFEL